MSFFAAAGLAQSLELLSAAREVADSIPEPGQYSGEEGTSFALQTARPSRYSHVQIETAVKHPSTRRKNSALVYVFVHRLLNADLFENK